MKMPGVTRRGGHAGERAEAPNEQPALDASIDTLASMLRVTGDYAFRLDADDGHFAELCERYARHVATGAPLSADAADADAGRDWRGVRHFYADRRKREYEFVEARAGNYRRLIEELSSGLRAVAERESVTESAVRLRLDRLDRIAAAQDLDAVRAAIAEATEAVAGAFAEQRQQFEAQLEQVHARMNSLRRDLELAREDLKHDALTDTLNRGAFDAALQQAVALNFVMRRSCVVVMLDIDHFKSINDDFGHVAGDEVLRGVADSLSRAFVRRSDIVARYGGEEFALILADAETPMVAGRVRDLLDTIRDTVRVGDGDAERPVTCSAGLTALLADDTAQSVVERADQALYEAKRSGRDRVVVAGGGPVAEPSDA